MDEISKKFWTHWEDPRRTGNDNIRHKFYIEHYVANKEISNLCVIQRRRIQGLTTLGCYLAVRATQFGNVLFITNGRRASISALMHAMHLSKLNLKYGSTATRRIEMFNENYISFIEVQRVMLNFDFGPYRTIIVDNFDHIEKIIDPCLPLEKSILLIHHFTEDLWNFVNGDDHVSLPDPVS